MAVNYSRTAFDGRRAASKRGLPTITHTNGYGFAALAVDNRARLTVAVKQTELVKGRLWVGAYSPLLGGFPVTHDGKRTTMRREDLNTLLQLSSDFRQARDRKTPPTVTVESVPLLTAWCATAKEPTMPLIEAIGKAA